MIEFFTLSWESHIFIIFILGLCVFSQTLALVLKFFRYELNKRHVFENLFEVFILIEILVFSLLYGQMVNAYKNGIVVETGYENIRIIIFIVILILAIFLSIRLKRTFFLSTIGVALISLPIMEGFIGNLYPWFFLGALIFFLIRSIQSAISSIIAIRTNISSLSIAHAMDNLPAGVLFSERNGYIILSNHQMQNLMIAITGKVCRNSLDFYEVLVSNKISTRYKKLDLDEQKVYLLRDGTAWIFTKTDISFFMESYIHISAADVTQLWILTSKLQLQDQELREKSEELKTTIANLHILSREKAIDNAKIRAHDILGQKLSLLLRMIQNEADLDYDLLISISKGLLEELKSDKDEAQAYDELKNIQGVFTAIGVEIKFKGKLPEDNHQAHLFIDIIRESSTNAVRHGFASEINIECKLVDNEYKLTINNNGYTSIKPITPGSGIKLMRKKVCEQNGNLDIVHHPIFTLSVDLPGGEEGG